MENIGALTHHGDEPLRPQACSRRKSTTVGVPTRTTPRMAVAIVAASTQLLTAPLISSLSTPDQDELIRCRLLDILAELSGLNGATIVVAVSNLQSPLVDPEFLPAGIDRLIVNGSANVEETARSIINRLHAKAFERVVVIAGDALPVPTSVAATALSALERAHLVVGPSWGGTWYAVGARDAVSLATLPRFQAESPENDTTPTVDPARAVRFLERRTTFSDIAETAKLRAELSRLKSPPRALLTWSERLSDS